MLVADLTLNHWVRPDCCNRSRRLMRKAFYAIPLLLAAALGFHSGRSLTQRKSDLPDTRRQFYYQGVEHSAYQSDKRGSSSATVMQIGPVYVGEAGNQITPTVGLTPYEQLLSGVRVATVEKTSGTRTLRIPGR